MDLFPTLFQNNLKPTKIQTKAYNKQCTKINNIQIFFNFEFGI
jgi:hypothetical protein